MEEQGASKVDLVVVVKDKEGLRTIMTLGEANHCNDLFIVLTFFINYLCFSLNIIPRTC